MTGLPVGFELAAAGLWWRGLGRSLLPAIAPQAGIRWTRAAMQARAALCAVDRQGRLVGITGLRDGTGGLIDWEQPMRPIFGPFGGAYGRAVLASWRAAPATRDLVLDGLVVRPWGRRQGVAHSLLHVAQNIARSRGFPALRVEVMADNHPARALYRSAGFTCRDRYSPGLGRRAVIMRLTV